MKTLLASLYLLFSGYHPLLSHARTETLEAAERNFARSALTTSTKQAFLANVSDSAVLLTGKGFVNAKAYWQAAPESASKIYWGPAFADISRGGDLGYTTGPFFVEIDKKKIAFGDYVTV